MLKLTYTEFGLHLERVTTPLEVVVSQRVILAMRTGATFHIEPSRASFLLPSTTSGLQDLAQMIHDEASAIGISPVDSEFVEISLQGSWIAQDAEAYEGTFIAAFPDRVEFFIHKLWQASQASLSSLV